MCCFDVCFFTHFYFSLWLRITGNVPRQLGKFSLHTVMSKHLCRKHSKIYSLSTDSACNIVLQKPSQNFSIFSQYCLKREIHTPYQPIRCHVKVWHRYNGIQGGFSNKIKLKVSFLLDTPVQTGKMYDSSPHI